MRVQIGADGREERGRDRIRRVRRQRQTHTAGVAAERVDRGTGFTHPLLDIGWTEADQLMKDPTAERALTEWDDGRERVAHVADERGACRPRPRDALPDRGEDGEVVAPVLLSCRQHGADPVEEARGRRNPPGKMRQLEVGVGVDQSGQDGHGPERHGVGRVALAHADDAPAVHRHHAMMDGLSHDREDPFGAQMSHR